MNSTLKSILLILLISFSFTVCFSQSDSTKAATSEKKINSEIGTTKGNYQIKATSVSTKVKPPSNFNLKSDKKLNTEAINKNLKKNKPNSNTQNFLMEELPEDKDIMGKRYWNGKDVTHQKLRSDLSLGTIKSKTRTIKIECRDFGDIDGDRIKIYLNDKLVSENIALKYNSFVLYVNLNEGYNKIDFEAQNQGSIGTNTSELNVYDNNDNLLTRKGWRLNSKQIATIGILYSK